jgi:hypothetical protein
MATVQNLFIDQGTTYELVVNLTNTDGSAKDLSTYTVAAQMRRSYYTNTYTAFTTDKVDLTGEITLSLTAAQTSAVKAGRYVYDIEITSVDETVRVLEGIITVTPEATK